MLFWKTIFGLHVTPMQNQSVLHKETIMCFVVTNVVMNFLQHSKALMICNIILMIDYVGYVDQNIDLHVILVHILHFTLSFDYIVLRKIDA
jgi:hypothetical protein